jgi:hypothetical protein
MTAIQASSAGIRDMADGTLRVTLEFEPRHAKEAFALFGIRGTQVAVAALKDGTYLEKPPEPPKEKVGALCKLAVQWCQDDAFQIWAQVQDEEAAKQFILATCECLSRKELDENMQCGDTFNRDIRMPYMKFLKENQ